MIFNSREYNIQFWQGEKLGSLLAIDTETTVVPFTETPDLITFQVFDGESLYYVSQEKVEEFMLMHNAHKMLFANAAFDIDVIEKHTNYKFKEAVENDRVYDVLILYRLWKLATDGQVPRMFSLAAVTRNVCGYELDKDTDVRCNFEQFQGTPVERIPQQFIDYGAKDVIATYDCYIRLKNEITKTKSETNLSHHIQLLGSLALNKMYKNGIGFDEERAKVALDSLTKQMEQKSQVMHMYGFVRGVKGNQSSYNYIVEYLGIRLPKTERGDFSMKEDDLLPFKNVPFIKNYLEYKKLEKTSQFISKLSGNRVHPRYDLLKNTGRTGCSSPNIQQLPRDGDVRSMFCAAPGNTFLITDYSAIELATLSQHVYTTQGQSVMKDKINDGKDLHKYYASVLFGLPEEKVEKWQRQAAKAANFGFPGGLGINTFIEFAKGYDLDVDEAKATEMRNTWFKAFPEMKQYMNGEKGSVMTLTGRLRNNTTYCAEKNTPFQGLAADGAKLALYNLMSKGFKLVGFVHDEIITEVPVDKVAELRVLQEKIMIDSMSIVVPDVTISVESTISDRYCK